MNSDASITITFAYNDVTKAVYSNTPCLFKTISSPNKCPEDTIHKGITLLSVLL